MRRRLDDIRDSLAIWLTTLVMTVIATRQYRETVAKNLMIGCQVSEAERKGMLHPGAKVFLGCDGCDCIL
jgi:hypothetical protein